MSVEKFDSWIYRFYGKLFKLMTTGFPFVSNKNLYFSTLQTMHLPQPFLPPIFSLLTPEKKKKNRNKSQQIKVF